MVACAVQHHTDPQRHKEANALALRQDSTQHFQQASFMSAGPLHQVYSFLLVQDNIVVSGDKKGQVAVWDFHKVTERSVYNINKALTNSMALRALLRWLSLLLRCR